MFFGNARRFFAVAMLLLLAGSISSAASPPYSYDYNYDVVTRWNEVTLGALRTGHSSMPGPTWAARNSAMVHAAMYDAVNSITQSHSPLIVNASAPVGTSQEAAVAKAAYTVLSQLYPAQIPAFTSAYNASIANIPDGVAKTNGIALGQSVGNTIFQARANDNSMVTIPYTQPANPGIWRPTGPLFGMALEPNWGSVTPFSMTSSTQFRSPAPPALNSPAYAAAYNEVKDLGALNSLNRTADQTEIGVFWGYDAPGYGTPPALYNQIARQVGIQAGNTLEENARMLALVNVAMADAGIAAWDTKYYYNVWRPITGIQEGHLDNNAATVGDPSWVPLGAPGTPSGSVPDFTPPFPAYTSGHATFGAATFEMLENFYGTEDLNAIIGGSLSLGSDELPGVFRQYDLLSELTEENGQSRIYLGIHWSFDKTAGITQGTLIADQVYGTMMLSAIPEPGTYALIGSALVSAAWYRRRRRQSLAA